MTMVFVMMAIFCIASVVSAGPRRHHPIKEETSPLDEGIASPSVLDQGLLNRHPSLSTASIDLPLGSSSSAPELANDASSSNLLLLKLSRKSQWQLNPQGADSEFFDAFAPVFTEKLTLMFKMIYIFEFKDRILSNPGWAVIGREIENLSSSIHGNMEQFLRSNPLFCAAWLQKLFCGDSHGSRENQYFPVLKKFLKTAAPVDPSNAGPLFYSNLHTAVVTVFLQYIADNPTLQEWKILTEFDSELEQCHSQIIQTILHDPNSFTRKAILLNGLMKPTLDAVISLRLDGAHCRDLFEKVIRKIGDCLHDDCAIYALNLVLQRVLFRHQNALSPTKSSLLAQYLWNLYKERLEGFVDTSQEILAWLYINDQIAIEHAACPSSCDSNHAQSVQQLINTLQETGVTVKIYKNRDMEPGEDGDLYFLKISPQFAKNFETYEYVLEEANQSFKKHLSDSYPE